MRPAVVILLCVAAAAVVLLALLARSRRGRSTPKQFGSTQEMMDWLANEAVALGRDNGVELDYTPQSIERAEQLLGKLHEEYRTRKTTAGVNGLAMAMGAYVGECIRRDNPGARWERDHEAAGKDSFPLVWRDDDVFPMGWCHKRIVNGPEDNVWFKYKMIRDDHTRGPAAKPAGDATD
jgi:hypothetical protein